MYRIFCESYQNFLNTFDTDSTRLSIAKPFELLVDIDKYNTEKNKKSKIYKKLCDLICFMNENIDKFPKMKAFLWTLDSREIIGKKYNISSYRTKLRNTAISLTHITSSNISFPISYAIIHFP